MPKNPVGKHIIADFSGCDFDILNNPIVLEEYMTEAAVTCGATVIGSSFHQFDPQGVTGVLVLAESHLSCHTYPEFGYIAIDCFTCGDTCDPEIALQFLEKKLNPAEITIQKCKRGYSTIVGGVEVG